MVDALERLTTEQRRALLQLARGAQANSSFLRYIEYVKPEYRWRWFHHVIISTCEALLEGTLAKDRVMVFVPPQHSKSELISRRFPAWALGRNPDLKIVACSYSATIAVGFSRAVQMQIDMPEYQMVFPNTWLNGSYGHPASKGYRRNVDNFETVGHSGFYKAVGVGGSLTGTPADIAIIDDPVKDREEAYSVTYRERAWEWYNSVLMTRLHNNSKILFVMTRWHEDDLAGRILAHEREKWEVITIPAVCEIEDDGELHSGRHVGEALWEEMHSLASLMEVSERSPRVFASLYQQRPVVEGGNIVKREWFRTCTVAEFKARRVRQPVHFYLDTAYNKRDTRTDNDPSGILAACRIGHDIYLVHAQRVWKEMPDLLRFLPEYVATHGGDASSVLHVEPKANGISVIQMLRKDTGLNVRATPSPRDSKETRLHVASPTIECGRVVMVEGAWNEDFLTEVCGFPAQPHDEFVDVLSYAIDDLGAGDIDWQKAARLNIF